MNAKRISGGLIHSLSITLIIACAIAAGWIFMGNETAMGANGSITNQSAVAATYEDDAVSASLAAAFENEIYVSFADYQVTLEENETTPEAEALLSQIYPDNPSCSIAAHRNPNGVVALASTGCM